MKEYQSYAGYVGAVVLITLVPIMIYFLDLGYLNINMYAMVFSVVAITFIFMLFSEYILKSRYNRKNKIKVKFSSLHCSNLYILKSALIRFIALIVPFLIFYSIVQYHNYFVNNNLFESTKYFFTYLLYIFTILGLPYIFLTLKYRGAKNYEFKDYALLTIIGVKSIYNKLFNKNYKHKFYKNRRVIKVLRLYLVNFFFLTLMARFVVIEIDGLHNSISTIYSREYESFSWYMQFKVWYLALFHLIFTVDVAIALIGYTFASRWLNNRTKSVDSTLSGWLVALMCYPPFNSVTSEFISYNGLNTHDFITNQYILVAIYTIIIFLYIIYVWATISLGFKFSNLTNRGVVSIGPYKYVRHPAYISKNLSWWLENSFILTNIWASIAMAMWNTIYVFRALTEERHLNKDSEYKNYCKKVKYRFIPKVI